MKNRSFSVMIFVIISILSVSCAYKVHSPSPFLKSFSLAETIKRMNLEEISVMSGETSGGHSGGSPTSRREEKDVVFTINEPRAESFDERDFLAKLQGQIKQEVTNAGLSIRGSGSGGDTFSINYESEEFKGGIDVIGIRIDKNKYRVWCVVRELALAKS